MGEGGNDSLAFRGYRTPIEGTPETELVQCGRGTPGGEYLRRFWQPVAYLYEIADAPLRARILGEDLVVFQDRSGAVGVLHLHCCHRGTSLEYGRVEEHGIRCCYHGRVFDVDGRMLEMPGERAAAKLAGEFAQGAYPTHLFGGIVFAYMGPIEAKPPFPMYDKYVLPGFKLAPGPRLPFACNWVQVKENSMDPAHTAILHAWEGVFAAEFGKFPEITWTETPVGMAYVAARGVGDKVWVRSTDILMPNIHSITSVFEDGQTLKDCSPPWITIWTVPEDDEHCVNFVLCHLTEDDERPQELRNRAMGVGQTPHRPYAERQKVPGDYDAMTSQGAIARHSLENLGSLDAGVVMFRRLLREGIRAVAAGRAPHGAVGAERPAATYGSDLVIRSTEAGIDPNDAEALMRFARATVAAYLKAPPLANRAIPRPPSIPGRAAAE